MIYREFQDVQLSNLGMGAMRLPVIGGDDSRVDEETVCRMVDKAMAGGVNYYDTAWGYHDGHSETALGKALARYPREKFFLADKFPGYDLHNMGKAEKIFEEQLRRCGVDYFDFYLFHNVCEMNIDAYLNDEKYGTYTYLISQKRSGRIRHLGFSAHGSVEVIRRFLEAYGKDMEFCQLQLNWLDWDFQDAKAKVALLKEWNIPVWVMEPLRGGKLARLPEEDAEKLRALRPDEGIPAWSFRFLQSIPEVKVILSGMSDEAQMEDNLHTFETDKPLNDTEKETLLSLAADMTRRTALPCTACRYCTTHCPKGLNIPWLLELYNEHKFTGGGFIAPMALMSLPAEKKPSACIGCRSCEKVCPQQIKISEAMKELSAKATW
ncbi:MAG: aldo/keto reductase [Clostridia bacterium]|nr:aldo/keto reductase [Clostridia bacterium]